LRPTFKKEKKKKTGTIAILQSTRFASKVVNSFTTFNILERSYIWKESLGSGSHLNSNRYCPSQGHISRRPDSGLYEGKGFSVICDNPVWILRKTILAIRYRSPLLLTPGYRGLPTEDSSSSNSYDQSYQSTLGKYSPHLYTGPSQKRNTSKMMNITTALMKGKIASLKTVTAEQWTQTQGTVEILVMSWNPLRVLVTHSGEILASL
jgi:hypothetical protein